VIRIQSIGHAGFLCIYVCLVYILHFPVRTSYGARVCPPNIASLHLSPSFLTTTILSFRPAEIECFKFRYSFRHIYAALPVWTLQLKYSQDIQNAQLLCRNYIKSLTWNTFRNVRAPHCHK
jgi:hypothetical protein